MAISKRTAKRCKFCRPEAAGSADRAVARHDSEPVSLRDENRAVSQIGKSWVALTEAATKAMSRRVVQRRRHAELEINHEIDATRILALHQGLALAGIVAAHETDSAIRSATRREMERIVESKKASLY